MTNDQIEKEIIKVIKFSIKPLALIDLIILFRDIMEHDTIRFYHILKGLINKRTLKKKYIDVETYYVMVN